VLIAFTRQQWLRERTSALRYNVRTLFVLLFMVSLTKLFLARTV